MIVTQDCTIRTITVYDPDGELSDEAAQEFATIMLTNYGGAIYWSFLDCERINYNKVAVRFERL